MTTLPLYPRDFSPSPSQSTRSSPRETIGWWLAILVVSVTTWDWLAAASVVLLWLAWYQLRTQDGLTVVALAFTFQWLQVCAGTLYYGITGRTSPLVLATNVRPMVLVGLCCLLALLEGLVLGRRWLREHTSPRNEPTPGVLPLTQPQIFGLYVVSVFVQGSLQVVAWHVPQLTQGLLAIGFVRYVILFILLRRLAQPRFRRVPFIAIVVVEVILSSTGYFADFREPLMIAVLTLLDIGKPRRVGHAASFVLIGALVLLTSLIWTAIKPDYRLAYREGAVESRTARIALIGHLTSEWIDGGTTRWQATFDKLADRVWAVYYPALAMRRVPAMVPYTDGAIFRNALVHIFTPRLFFKDKPDLISDSDKVREYSGVWVAGEESGTSIAFGYAAESYVDFGIPWMFIPVFCWGVAMGASISWLRQRIRYGELAIAVTTIVAWLPLYLFERSWAMMMGLAITMLVFLGGAAMLFDRILAARSSTRRVVNLRVPASAPIVSTQN